MIGSLLMLKWGPPLICFRCIYIHYIKSCMLVPSQKHNPFLPVKDGKLENINVPSTSNSPKASTLNLTLSYKA